MGSLKSCWSSTCKFLVKKYVTINKIRHLFQCKSGKHQVNVNTIKTKLNNWDESIRNRSEISDLVLNSNHVKEGGEVVLPKDVSGRHTKGINISSLIMNSKAI